MHPPCSSLGIVSRRMNVYNSLILKASKIILFDASDSPHFADFCSGTDNLDSHVRTRLDDGVFVVSKLWRCRVRVPFDVAGYQMSRYKQSEGTSLGEEALWIDGVDDGINRLSFEWPPYDCAISNSKLCETIARQDPAFGNVEGVHDGDDVVAAGAGTFDIFQQLASHQIVHVTAKVGRVQGDPPLHVVEEEHVGL